MRHIFAILVLLLPACSALADGKLYARESVPPDVPYQRALILFQAGQQTLVLQSKFETSGTHLADSVLGWVVPAPAVPELASMNAQDAWRLFRDLGTFSSPKVTQLGGMISTVLFLIVFATSIISLLLCLLSFFVPQLKSISKLRGRLARFALYGLIACILALFAIPSFIRAQDAFGVDVLSSEQIGIYDAKVIKSDSSAALIAWLNENGFQFTPSDAPIVDGYIKEDWCFVVAKVRPEEASSVTLGSDGLIDPLILRFASDSPVYPLALTSTIGVETEVLLYLLSDRRMECGERMKLHFAGRYDAEILNFLTRDSKEYFRPWETSLGYLCKFKGRLTSAQMKEDLSFAPVNKDSPYREHIIKW